MMEEKSKSLEEQVSHVLEEGHIEKPNPEEEARRRLIPRYEVRTQAKLDPIVEETRIIRKISREIDGRYDKYLSRIPLNNKKD